MRSACCPRHGAEARGSTRGMPRCRNSSDLYGSCGSPRWLDMGLFDDLHPVIASRDALVDGTPGVDIYSELAPAPGEHGIKKHRYSAFFGTDLDIIVRESGVDAVIISGSTIEIAVMRRQAMRCFATIASCFSRTRRRPSSIALWHGLDAECRGSSCDPRHTRDVDGACNAGSRFGCPSGEFPPLRRGFLAPAPAAGGYRASCDIAVGRK